MSGGSPLSPAQRLYVTLHEAEEQSWELRSPVGLAVSGLLRQAMRLLLDADPETAAGVPYEPYTRFDSPELQEPPNA